jgi:hypothetical protein
MLVVPQRTEVPGKILISPKLLPSGKYAIPKFHSMKDSFEVLFVSS